MGHENGVNELQSHCAKNGSDGFSLFLAMIKVIAIKLVKFFIAKSLKLNHRYLISIMCMLLFACRIFSAINSTCFFYKRNVYKHTEPDFW